MKTRIFFAIFLVTTVVILVLNSSKNTFERNDLDIKTLKYKVYYKGSEIKIPDREQRNYKQQFAEWSDSFASFGSIDLNSYAPDIVLKSDDITINLGFKTVFNLRYSDHDMRQYSRNPTLQDKKFKSYILEQIQKQ